MGYQYKNKEIFVMARKHASGKVTGEVWRVHETDKEFICFMLENEPVWFRIEYNKNIMPERTNYMAEMLALAAQKESGIEVALEDESSGGEKRPLFREVKYIQIRAQQPTVSPGESEAKWCASAAMVDFSRK